MHNLPAHDSVTARIGSARLHASPPVLLRGIEATGRVLLLDTVDADGEEAISATSAATGL